ncbi:MAG: sulfite exporter TauE/SafE family protein [Deltaproteobacteria bacterium]|nr:sulfite exporter TauE/SafE family protein [Deltaproteobacteria bacterium]
MPESVLAQAILFAAVFLVAMLYSSVGHGGASGYLAVLALFSVLPRIAGTSALVLNILVAGIAWITFWKGGHFSWPLVLPFLVGSIPAAYFGGLLRSPEPLLYILLAVVLAVAALRMVLPFKQESGISTKGHPPLFSSVGIGAGLGLVSGMIGIGGGIFLSPIMILRGWAPLRTAAGVSAFFIVINSFAGLAGRGTNELIYAIPFAPLVGFAFAGGALGSWLGSKKFSMKGLRYLLALVLLIAAVKVLVMEMSR